VTAKRPLRADAQRNRDHVLDVANQVFATEGLEVPIDEIARRAGLGVGTLYRHFPTKEALFMAIVLRRMEQVAADAQALGAAKDPGAAFFAFLSNLIDDAPAKRDLMMALAAAGFDPHRTGAKTKTEIKHAVGKLLARAQEAGAVRPDVLVGEVFSLVNGVHAAISAYPRDERSRARLVDIVFDGLRGRPTEASATRRRASR
jgi:AcrR family transcriptional regulator